MELSRRNFIKGSGSGGSGSEFGWSCSCIRMLFCIPEPIFR